MFSSALTAAKRKVTSLQPDEEEISPLEPSCLPENYTLADVQTLIPSKPQSKEDALPSLLILNACLTPSSPSHLQISSKDDNVEIIDEISLWLSQVIVPDGNIVAQDEVPDGTSPETIHQNILLTRRIAHLGLTTLFHLLSLNPTPKPNPLSPKILLAILTLTSPSDPWTTPSLIQKSSQLLTNYTSQLQSQEFITYLLQSYLRPLFSSSAPTTVTAAGRKAQDSNNEGRSRGVVDLRREAKPWKYVATGSVAVLEWVVENISQELYKTTFHLLIPPLLTLVSDPSTPYRVRGLYLLRTYLQHLPTPQKTLKQTGLGSVFEEAVLPTLMYVPSITPLEESLLLLPKAYEALFTLCDLQLPVPTLETSAKDAVIVTIITATLKSKSRAERDEEEKAIQKHRLKLLDKILRQGILSAYQHCPELPSLVQILVSNLSRLIQKMGIHTVKHLKHIIPLLGSILTDPFGASHPALLLETILCLQTLILNTWPRLNDRGKRLEVVKMLGVSWTSVVQEEEKGGAKQREGEIGELKKEIKKTGKILVKAVEGMEDVDFNSEVGRIIEAVPGLSEVFGMDVDYV